jgi:hypothetical protein
VAASSPPGERVDAHGRRRGAPEQNQKDAQASELGDTRRNHRTAQQNEKSTPAFEGATGSHTRSVTVEHEKGHRRRSSERTKNATAVVGKDGPAEVTKTGPSNETQMQRKH